MTDSPLKGLALAREAATILAWDEGDQTHRPFALDVLTVRDARISEITSFITRTIELPEDLSFATWPDQPADPARLALYYEAFGLPDRLD